MKLVNIPFRKIWANDIPRPCLAISIANSKTEKSFNTYGIIDTGADECTFPAQIAPIIGLKLKEGKCKKIITAGGETDAYSHKVSMDIQGFRLDNILIDFVPNLNIPLLGTKSFLANFVLTIDYPHHKFSLKRPAK